MGCTPAFTYNDAQFRQQFKAFADPTAYPEDTLSMYFDEAGTIVSNSNYGRLAQTCATLLCLYLLTAHLAQIGTLIANGQTPTIITGATIDKITVGLKPPETPSQLSWWLNTTPYGAQLLTILQVKSVGGFYQPGGLGRAGFGPRVGGLS